MPVNFQDRFFGGWSLGFRTQSYANGHVEWPLLHVYTFCFMFAAFKSVTLGVKRWKRRSGRSSVLWRGSIVSYGCASVSVSAPSLSNGSPFSSILPFGPFFSSLHFSDEPLKWPIYHLTNQHNGIDWRSPRRPCPGVASPEGLRENDLQLPNTESSHLLNITTGMKHSGASGILCLRSFLIASLSESL